MKARTTLLLFALALGATTFLGTTTASAQSADLGLNFLVGVPTGEFADTLDRTGFGLAFDAGYHFGQVPLQLGLQVGFMTYGEESRKEPWSTTIPDVTVDVNTSYNIGLLHLYLRLIPETGMIRPYVQGMAGYNYLFTSTSVKSENGNENGEIASSTNYDDGAFSYGAAAGVQIELWQPDADEVTADGPSSVQLDLRGGYLAGEQASYLTTGSVKRTNGTVSYAPKSSRTDMITAQLGVTVRF